MRLAGLPLFLALSLGCAPAPEHVVRGLEEPSIAAGWIPVPIQGGCLIMVPVGMENEPADETWDQQCIRGRALEGYGSLRFPFDDGYGIATGTFTAGVMHGPFVLREYDSAGVLRKELQAHFNMGCNVDVEQPCTPYVAN